MRLVRTLACLAATVFTVAAWAADFGGTYKGSADGEEITLTLKQSGNSLSGEAKAGPIAMQVTGTVDGDQAKGTLKVFTESLYFTAKFEGETLVFKVSEDQDMAEPDTIRFTRTGSKPEPEKTEPGKIEGTAKKPEAFSKEPSALLKSGKEYTHSSGGKFRYPAGWEVREGEGYVQLVPPDPKPGEIIIIRAESAQGATDPGSAEILAYLDGAMAESVPDARREGKPETAVAGAGKGVILNWNGTVEGRKAHIRGYITIIKNYGVALLAVGSKETVDSRDKDLRAIFQTIGWGQGKINPQLVGTWNYWGYKGSSDGKYGREEKATCVLNADGSFTYSNSAETSISASGKDAGGNETWVGGMNSRRGNGWGGTWSATDSVIILNFEDGTSETFNYRFEQQGANTFLVTTDESGKAKMEWSRG